MDSLRLALTILTIITVAGPLCWAFITYRDNLLTLLIPEVEPRFLRGPEIKYLGSRYDSQLKTVVIIFNITNPYNKTLTIRSVSGEIFCSDHNEFLGNISLSDGPVSLQPEAATTVLLTVNYAKEGIDHIATYHSHEETEIYVDFRNLSINIQGIVFHLEYERVKLTLMSGS